MHRVQNLVDAVCICNILRIFIALRKSAAGDLARSSGLDALATRVSLYCGRVAGEDAS